MDMDERMERSGTYSAFRTSLDIGMGAVYIIIGVIVFNIRYFGTMELSATTAYIFGGMLVLYGAFRIYRGIAVILRRRKPNSPSNTE